MEKVEKTKLTPVFTLLGSALKTWWENLGKFIKVYLWGLLYTMIPLVVILLLIGLGFVGNLGSSMGYRFVAVFIGIWAVLFALYYSIRTYLAIFLLVKHDFSGQELDLFKKSADYFWSYISLVLMMMVLIFLWLFALIIPAIIFSVFYAFSVYAFMFEGKRDIDAVKRSKELVKGYWWAVFGRIFLFCLIIWTFIGILSIPLRFVPQDSTFAYVWNGLIQVVSYLVGPFGLLFSYGIFKDLVKIKK